MNLFRSAKHPREFNSINIEAAFADKPLQCDGAAASKASPAALHRDLPGKVKVASQEFALGFQYNCTLKFRFNPNGATNKSMRTPQT